MLSVEVLVSGVLGGTEETDMEHILSLSYGKDSLACLGAIEELGRPIDRIVHAEVWATDTIPADLPPMVEFKRKADSIIKKRWGIEVEHVRIDTTFERQFYTCYKSGDWAGKIYGWPKTCGSWCTDRLKTRALDRVKKGAITYVGIAEDETERINRAGEKPLVEAGWTEADCLTYCKSVGLLSPIYTSCSRGGCWFCPKQPIGSLRSLRRKYPEMWSLMLNWDKDSYRTFRADGHTIHDFDRRFQAEDDGFISEYDKSFRWDILDMELNYRWF